MSRQEILDIDAVGDLGTLGSQTDRAFHAIRAVYFDAKGQITAANVAAYNAELADMENHRHTAAHKLRQ